MDPKQITFCDQRLGIPATMMKIKERCTGSTARYRFYLIIQKALTHPCQKESTSIAVNKYHERRVMETPTASTMNDFIGMLIFDGV